MDFSAIINFIVIVGIVWGGFAFALSMAIRKEKSKN